jgi:hypothetical protein
MASENTNGINEPKERSGNYRIVKICIHEIEAMKKLGFSRKTILERLETHFGNTMTPDQLSSNLTRINNDSKKSKESKEFKEEEAKLRKERTAEIVKNPELIPKNFLTYQLIINPNSVESTFNYDRRISPQQASAKTHQITLKSGSPSQAQAKIHQTQTAAPMSPQFKQPDKPRTHAQLEKPTVTAIAPNETIEIDSMMEEIQTYLEKTCTRYSKSRLPEMRTMLLANIDSLQGKMPVEIVEQYLALLLG